MCLCVVMCVCVCVYIFICVISVFVFVICVYMLLYVVYIRHRAFGAHGACSQTLSAVGALKGWDPGAASRTSIRDDRVSGIKYICQPGIPQAHFKRCSKLFKRTSMGFKRASMSVKNNFHNSFEMRLRRASAPQTAIANSWKRRVKICVFIAVTSFEVRLRRASAPQ